MLFIYHQTIASFFSSKGLWYSSPTLTASGGVHLSHAWRASGGPLKGARPGGKACRCLWLISISMLISRGLPTPPPATIPRRHVYPHRGLRAGSWVYGFTVFLDFHSPFPEAFSSPVSFSPTTQQVEVWLWAPYGRLALDSRSRPNGQAEGSQEALRQTTISPFLKWSHLYLNEIIFQLSLSLVSFIPLPSGPLSLHVRLVAFFV